MAHSISLKINCGYARVAIRSLSEMEKGKHHYEINQHTRAQKFRQLFASSFALPNSYFEGKEGRTALFNRHCKQILGAFTKHWGDRDTRKSYTSTFSICNWERLAKSEKARHSLSNCKECARKYNHLQSLFPGQKYSLSPKSTAIRDYISEATHTNETARSTKNATTKLVIDELNSSYEQQFGEPFTQTLLTLPGSGLQRKTTAVERKSLKRKHQRECRDTITDHYYQQDAINVLAEGQSLCTYKRMRMAQSFETPEQKKERIKHCPSKPRKHSPTFDNIKWDKESVLRDLQNWPRSEKINWTKFATEHGISGRNRGQIVKEFALDNQIDVEELDHRPLNKRIRAKKLKMPGTSVAFPCHRSVEGVKEDWSKMVDNGTLTLGETCAPQTLTKRSVVNGELTIQEETVYGRKIPFMSIRMKLLHKHEPYMRLHTDMELKSMTTQELIQHYQKLHIKLPDEITDDNLREKLATCERTRSWAFWHDHATIAGKGYILVTCNVVYDSAVFKRDDEIQQGSEINIQAYIEEPEIHIIALSSSSLEDQAALISDRLECIKELTKQITTKNDITVTDKLFFFTGDKPAAQFERGTQQGGYYKCGSCGCRSTRMDDLAYSLNCKWRSLTDLQTLVLAGEYIHVCISILSILRSKVMCIK